MQEDFADNAFVYASVQLMKIGGREDGWHTDGGASLLHAAVTVFGSRTLQVKPEDAGCISFPQRPGSFYVGNLCALSHIVVHGEHAAGSYGGTRRRSRCTSLLWCELTFSEQREPAQLMQHQGLRSCSKS